jgi:hypothetical protein
MNFKILAVILTLILSLPMALGAQTEQPESKGIEVTAAVDAELCTDISERMPVGSADTFSPDVGKIYLWCNVTGMSTPTSITHVWYYEGEEKAAVVLEVNGNPWRTWSSKTILPGWTGGWEVKVQDPEGKILATVPFTITP